MAGSETIPVPKICVPFWPKRSESEQHGGVEQAVMHVPPLVLAELPVDVPVPAEVAAPLARVTGALLQASQARASPKERANGFEGRTK